MSAFSKRELISAATTLPWTRNFRHLQGFPRHWLRRSSFRGDIPLKSVRPADRIKYWNIVPGDQIRVLGEKDKGLREVLSINRISNRVFVKGLAESKDKNPKPGRVPQSKNFHYSRCQLFVGTYEFPPLKGSVESRFLPVFAQRIGTTKPYWNKRCHRHEWTRFATKLVPQVPYQLGQQQQVIPWPKPDRPTPSEPGLYDTLEQEVTKVTYKPPSATLKGPLPRPPSEKEYLRSLLNNAEEYDPSHFASAPLEIYLAKELSNPYSRAKRQARWQAYHHRTKALLQEYIDAELRNLNGRTQREARAEAAWKWRAKLEEDRHDLKKRRWKHKANVAKVERKKTRKTKKDEQQRQRLTSMVLEEAKNQVIPKSFSE